MKWGYQEVYSPLSQWHDPKVQALFCQIVLLKKTGYDQNYENSLPIDTLDLISDHHLVWLEKNGMRKIVACLRSINAQTIERYKLDSPSHSLLKTIGKEQDISKHLHFLKNIYHEFKDSLDKIRFYNGWTIDPSYRGRGETSALLRLASTASIYFTQKELNASIVLCSAMEHLKVDQMLHQMGYEVWSDENNVPLMALSSPAFDQLKTLFMFCRSNRSEYLKQIEFLENPWQRREIIGVPRDLIKREAA
jgi:hypothetical protein